MFHQMEMFIGKIPIYTMFGDNLIKIDFKWRISKL